MKELSYLFQFADFVFLYLIYRRTSPHLYVLQGLLRSRRLLDAARAAGAASCVSGLLNQLILLGSVFDVRIIDKVIVSKNSRLNYKEIVQIDIAFIQLDNASRSRMQETPSMSAMPRYRNAIE